MIARLLQAYARAPEPVRALAVVPLVAVAVVGAGAALAATRVLLELEHAEERA